MNGKPPARGARDPPGQSAAVCDFEAARGHRWEQKRLSSTHQGASEVQMRAHCNTCVSPFSIFNDRANFPHRGLQFHSFATSIDELTASRGVGYKN